MMNAEILCASLKLSSFTSPLVCMKIMECLLNSKLSLLSSNPLFSCIVTFYTLILIYLPHHFSKIFFSPVLILTASLLFSILRLGVTQKYSHTRNKENLGESEGKLKENEENKASNEKRETNSTEETQPSSFDEVQLWITHNSETEFSSQIGFDTNPCFVDSFVEWNVKAPLEVIYEEAEDESNGKEENTRFGIERYPSLSLYYPETDSDSSSECEFPVNGKWESPDNACFIWEEEDREGLIEIALNGAANDKKINTEEFRVEEDSLIEIDISLERYDEITGDNSRFSGAIDSIYSMGCM